MKNLIPVLALLFIGATANAQTHSASFSWNDPITGAVYNLYRAPCTGTITANVCSAEGTFVKIATTPLNASSITDATLAAGQSYSWYMTTLCATGGQCPTGTVGESAPSNHVAGTTTFNIPPPPSITITNIAITNVNGQDRFQADWTDSGNGTTAFTIFGGKGQILKQASQTTANGIYSYAILIPVQNGVFTVCNGTGACASKAFTGI